MTLSKLYKPYIYKFSIISNNKDNQEKKISIHDTTDTEIVIEDEFNGVNGIDESDIFSFLHTENKTERSISYFNDYYNRVNKN